MAYQIVVEFPNKKTADAFCGQMSDGFGENHCDFSFYRLKPGAKGDKDSDYEEVYDKEGRRVYFVPKLFNRL